MPNAYNSLYLPALDTWYPRSAFFVIWNSWPTGPFVAIKDNANYIPLLTDPRVTNRETVNYVNTTAYWQIAHGLLNKPLTGDFDNDGVADVMEAALGLNPLVCSSAGLPMLGFSTVSGQNYSTITFTRDTANTELTLAVQWSSDLINWSTGSSYGPSGIISSTAITSEVARALSGSIETITVRSNTPASAGAQFMRLKVDGP